MGRMDAAEECYTAYRESERWWPEPPVVAAGLGVDDRSAMVDHADDDAEGGDA